MRMHVMYISIEIENFKGAPLELRYAVCLWLEVSPCVQAARFACMQDV